MMIKLFVVLGVLFLCLYAVGCSRMKIEDFKGKEPEIDPIQFFVGETEGHGYFYNRWGDIKTTLTIHLTGRLNERNELLVDEHLVYASGDESRRTFHITKKAENEYVVTCKDFSGPGTITAAGNALNWKYILNQDIGGRVVSLRFDDWMFKQTETLVLNRAKAYWYGIEVGELFLVVEKKGDS